MNPPPLSDAEVIDLTGDVSDPNESPDESCKDENGPESPWRSLHLTGMPC
jgi:hypothetical protein